MVGVRWGGPESGPDASGAHSRTLARYPSAQHPRVRQPVLWATRPLELSACDAGGKLRAESGLGEARAWAKELKFSLPVAHPELTRSAGEHRVALVADLLARVGRREHLPYPP